MKPRVRPEDLLKGGRDAAVVADDVAEAPPPQVLQLTGAEASGGAVLVGEEEPVSGTQGVELARDDVAEGQADVAVG